MSLSAYGNLPPDTRESASTVRADVVHVDDRADPIRVWR